jgi:hypothetical protein
MKVKSRVYIHNMRLRECNITPSPGTSAGKPYPCRHQRSILTATFACTRSLWLSSAASGIAGLATCGGGRGGTEGGPSRLVVNRQLFCAPLRDRQGNATDARELVLSAAATGRLTMGAFRSCIFGPVPKTGATEVDVPSGECLTINWRFPQLSPGKGDECLHLLVISA